MIILSGRQYKDFLNAEWGCDAMWDGYSLWVNGKLVDEEFDDFSVQDSDQIKFRGGTIYPDQKDAKITVNAESFCRKWLHLQSTADILISVDKDRVDAFLALVEQFGARASLFSSAAPKPPACV